MPGGATASGAPRGNRNAVTHGPYTASAIAGRRAIIDEVAAVGRLFRKLEDVRADEVGD